MKNIAVVNGIGLREPAFRPLGGGASSFERVREYGKRLPGVDEVVLLLSRDTPMPRGCRAIIRESWTVAELLAEIARAAGDCDHVFYFFADCPFLDPVVTGRMYESHRKYWADYTFADGYPWGLAPEILTRETVKRLVSLVGDGAGEPDRETIFAVIKKDINSFDIETELSPRDMRMLRVILAGSTEREFLLLSRIAQAGGRDAESVCRIIDQDPTLLRTLPAFFPVQVVERCPHACAYCPHPVVCGDALARGGTMPAERFEGLVRKISSFAHEAVVDISLWGEPSLHPRVFDLVSAVLGVAGLDLVIETSGVGWDPAVFSRIRDSFGRQPTWIVSLDASREDVHQRLRGQGFAEAMKTADTLLTLFPAKTWVQAVRMKENEEDLEVFYKSWKARTENIIIQKYDSFCGFLPDRKVADLSPLKRFPCWHVKRDMAVLLDGTVPLCREDLRAENRLGNALGEDLAVLWERGAATYRAHLAGDWPGICAGCDEYYTFNF